MDRSYPYTRRLISRARLHKRMAAMATVGVVGLAALLVVAWNPDPVAAAAPSPASAAPGMPAMAGGAKAEPRTPRRVYPYSVVPGGVSGQAELARVVRSDKVVATHYASFDVARARPVTVEKPRAVHVSYRKGDQVYWTARKVMLAQGETLLTDGSNEMRARCANRISDTPQYPIEAHAPAMEELDTPVDLDGEEYALGTDEGSFAQVNADGIGRQDGPRLRPGGGAVSTSTVRDATLAHSTSSFGGPEAPAFMNAGLSGSSSLGIRSLPVSDPASAPQAGASPDAGGSTGAQSPSESTPAPVPAAPTVEETVPPYTSWPSPEPVTPGNGTQPGSPALPGSPGAPTPGEQAGGGSTGGGLPPAFPPTVPTIPTVPTDPGPQVPNPGPDPVTDPGPFLPPPELAPGPPKDQTGPEKPPADVPEPASAWLFAGAFAAMLVLRRKRL